MAQEIVIHDGNYLQHLAPVIQGEQKGRGCYARNYLTHPHGCFAFARPFNLPLIPQSDQQKMLDQQIAAKAQLSNIRLTGNAGQPIPSRDQNGKGYCWAHSGVSAHLIARAKMNEPYVDLSAYGIACMVKGFRDEGGWGSEGIEFQASKGCPSSKTWPQQSMSRSNDNPNTWTEAHQHRYLDWMELDPNNMIEQLKTCLLLGYPVVTDFNWWSHSVCTIDLVSINPLSTRIWNSWGDSWSDKGMGILQGQKARPDSAWACIVTTASAA